MLGWQRSNGAEPNDLWVFDFPLVATQLLTPFNHAFLSLSSVASACDERAHKVSTHTCFVGLSFFVKLKVSVCDCKATLS